MHNLHCGGRFLRFLRSIGAKTVCARRAIVALFVAVATILATFMIAPTYALSAGEGAGEKVSTEKAEGAQSGSAKSEGENKQQPNQSESNSTEINQGNNTGNNTGNNQGNNTGSSSALTNDNKESKSVEKQPTASNNGVDSTKSEKFANETDAKQKAEGAKKKDVSTETALKMNRSARKLKECSTLSACYNISYDFGNATTVDNGKTILINRGDARPITPKFDLKPKKKPATNNLLDGLWFKLEKDGEDSVPSWANFEKDNGATKVKDTSKDKAGFNGSVTLRPGKWDNRGSHKFKIVIYRTDRDKKIVYISVKIDESDISKNDLSLSLYDFGKADDKVSVSNDKITIKPKSKGSAPSGGTDGSDTDGTGKKDTYDPINKLFIESQSKDKPGFIYHRMICHETGSDDNASYTVGSVNGLSLGTQTQFKHMENQNRPDKNAENSAVYEDDKYTEESQRWISGTPTKAGTFECKVFAVKKDDGFKLKRPSQGGKTDVYSTVLDEFDTRVETNKQSLFDNPEKNIVEDKWTNKASIKQGVDWDYKTITIQFGDKPKPPTIGDNDLTLKVYPFKDSTTALTSDNNEISAILGMSLKPFVDATSATDSANKITLRVLCSKGEKKNAGSRSEQPSEQSQPTQPSGSSQSAEDLEYKTWSSNLAELGLSVPADDNQNTCHSNKEGEKTCESVDPSKKVAARTDMEVSIKPTEVGNYQCVVYALKPAALAKFDGLTGTLTPESIKSELTQVTEGSPTAFKENMDFAAFMFNIDIDSVSKFTLPNTGERNWNLQLGAVAAVMVSVLAAGFVISQSEACRKLLYERRRC